MANRNLRKAGRRIVRRMARLPLDVHRHQQGTISIVSVFAVMLLTMLLGMVMNVGRHVNDKIRMQNTADTAAYSGGLVLARGMNTLAFTNHLLFDVFAMTAFMREARDRNSEPHVPDILAAWNKEGPKFSDSGFAKFERLGPAIVQKVPLEQELVRTYSDWAAAASQRILPVMEEILRQRMIPEYQRALVQTIPELAQTAMAEIARRQAGSLPDRGPITAVLWRGTGATVGGEDELVDPSLAVVDPVMGSSTDRLRYMEAARSQRRTMAVKYLSDWNREAMAMFDYEAKMCQFARLWRHFTCLQLNRLLDEEYPTTNLPHLIRTETPLEPCSSCGAPVPPATTFPTGHLDWHYHYVCVVYRQKLPEMLPGLFRNPIQGHAIAYAQVNVFVPCRRIVWYWVEPGDSQRWAGNIGGHRPPLPPPDEPAEPDDDENEQTGRWVLGPEPGMSSEWSLLNQRWSVQLVPATTPALANILQTVPPTLGEPIELPNLGRLSTRDINRISPH